MGDYVDISEDILRKWRPEMAERQPKARCKDFDEVAFGFTEEQALAEAQRCLQCGACCECRECETACEEIGAIDHFRKETRFNIDSPAIIIADEDELPENMPDDKTNLFNIHPIRTGGIKGSGGLMDVLVAGSAAAGQAMVTADSLKVEGGKKKIKPITFPDESSIGFFMCECNGSMAPKGVLDKIVDMANMAPNVAHAQKIVSVCHPAGSKMIAETVKKKKLARVIVASCVCCPLEFYCISCNDQRTRARIQLFDVHGLDRSRFETINLKGFLNRENEDDNVMVARNHLRGAFLRARFLGPLRQGETEMGKNVLILGGSEVGTSCAKNLKNKGFNVRIVHRCALDVPENMPDSVRDRVIDKSQMKNIKHVDNALVYRLSGSIGNYRVSAESEGKKKRWKPDIVCLTDPNMNRLALPEEMKGLKKFYRYDFAFFHTPQLGLFRVMPRTLKRVSPAEAGAALAAQVASAAAEAFLQDYQLSPIIDPERCRGCGRCVEICPFEAIYLKANEKGLYIAQMIQHNCVGCGGCVGRCPVTALDMPYFSNQLLKEIVAETLTGGALR